MLPASISILLLAILGLPVLLVAAVVVLALALAILLLPVAVIALVVFLIVRGVKKSKQKKADTTID